MPRARGVVGGYWRILRGRRRRDGAVRGTHDDLGEETVGIGPGRRDHRRSAQQTDRRLDDQDGGHGDRQSTAICAPELHAAIVGAGARQYNRLHVARPSHADCAAGLRPPLLPCGEGRQLRPDDLSSPARMPEAYTIRHPLPLRPWPPVHGFPGRRSVPRNHGSSIRCRRRFPTAAWPRHLPNWTSGRVRPRKRHLGRRPSPPRPCGSSGSATRHYKYLSDTRRSPASPGGTCPARSRPDCRWRPWVASTGRGLHGRGAAHPSAHRASGRSRPAILPG